MCIGPGGDVLPANKNTDLSCSTACNHIGLHLIAENTRSVGAAHEIKLASALINQNHTSTLFFVHFYEVVSQNGDLSAVVRVEQYVSYNLPMNRHKIYYLWVPPIGHLKWLKFTIFSIT